MTKVYIANTPLILQDAAGKEYRVEAGEAVQLTPEQYQDVAAHVTETSINEAGLPAADDAPDSETPPPEAPADTPKRARGKAEA